MRRTSIIQVSSVLVMMATVACGPPQSRNGSGDDDAVDAGPGTDADQQFPPDDSTTAGCQKLDLLFVIDNSGSMGEEQANLVANFPTFINVLDASGLDYRVAVTTTARDYHYTMSSPIGGGIPQSTGAGEDGTMLKPAACNMTKRWIDKGDPDPAQTFSCVANVGTGGNSDEMPLGGMRDAFEDRMADQTNAGFRRTDALLGVVFLTDEEDCSYEQSVTLSFAQGLCDAQMEPATNYVAFLDQYTGHRTRWAAAAIAGMGPGSCSSSFGNAAEATRLKAFVAAAGAQARMSSICDGDLSASLQQTLALFQSACGGVIF
ncbi:MAG: putative lipoprotein [Myxococcales bacterium]|nr:putative lipoprotein [Myxococcales bacterium]